MTIFRGINVAKGMVDVDDPKVALGNLGLNRDDFDLIAGLTEAGNDVGISDFHSLSGLVVPQQTTLQSLTSCAEQTERVLDTMADIRVPLDFNANIDNNKLVGGAIKFSYLDFNSTISDSGTFWSTKKADISTSRISSWSPVGPPGSEDDYILYGGEVKVTGDYLSYTDLETTEAPIAKKFRGEVATHTLSVKVADSSGTANTHQLLVMKGIPLTWSAYFRDADLGASIVSGGVTDSSGAVIPVTWQITNQDDGLSYNSGDGSSTYPGNLGIGTSTVPALYPFRDTASKPRTLEFFYDPGKIERLDIKYINLLDWTNVTLPALKILNLEGNDFSVIPQFRSDAQTSMAGYSGGKGLATSLEEIVLTGNNLSRAPNYLTGRNGFTETTAATAGTASAQLNRLPATMKKITVNGCFKDNTTVDLRDYLDLTHFTFKAEYQRELRRQMFTHGPSPLTYDGLEATTGLKLKAGLFSSDVNAPITLSDSHAADSDYIANTWFNTSYAMADTDKIYVRIDFKVGSDSKMGSITSITDGAVYILYKNAFSASTHKYVLRTQDDSDPVTVSNTHVANAEGGFVMTRCDSSGNDIIFNPTKGIDTYNIHDQNYTQLSPGTYRSPNLTYLDIRSNNGLFTNSEFPYYDSTSNATKIASSADMAIPTPVSDNLVRFYTEYATHNIINFSGKPNLKTIRAAHMNMSTKWQTAEKTIDGKFDNLPELEYLSLYNTKRSAGNYKTNGMFQNKPKMTWADIRWGWGHYGSLRDDTFSGSDSLDHWLEAGTKGRFTNDKFGTSGSAGHTGQVFANSTKLKRIYIYGDWTGSGAFISEAGSANDLNLANCTILNRIYAPSNDLRGALPNFSANTKLQHLYVHNCSITKNMEWGQPGQTYTILTKRTDGNNGATTNQWTQAGWVSEGTDPVTGAAHTTTPTVGDSFVYAAPIDVTTTQLEAGKRYKIRDVGTTSNANWGALGASTSPYQGRNFTATGNATVAGNGKVLVRTFDRIKGRGLTGNFPEFNQSGLSGIWAYNNSFSGQMPKQDLTKIYLMYLQRNEFTGSIPDLSSCPNLHKFKMHDNKLSTYTAGFLKDNLRMTKFDFSNNRLRASIATDLIYDLYENYLARPRGGVTLDFLGQSDPDGQNTLSQSAVETDGTTGPESSANKLSALRNNGWTILLD